MNLNDMFPGQYLKAGDLKGHSVEVVIDRMEMEEIGGETKPVIYFQDKERGLVLNKTNGLSIAEAYGPESDDWLGQRITLYPTKVDFQGKRVDAIRIHTPQVQPPAAGDDDEIPF